MTFQVDLHSKTLGMCFHSKADDVIDVGREMSRSSCSDRQLGKTHADRYSHSHRLFSNKLSLRKRKEKENEGDRGKASKGVGFVRPKNAGQFSWVAQLYNNRALLTGVSSVAICSFLTGRGVHGPWGWENEEVFFFMERGW